MKASEPAVIQILTARFHAAMEGAGIPYRIVGGLATFIHVYERQPIKAWLTQDVDAGVARDDLQRIIQAAETVVLSTGTSRVSTCQRLSAVHLIFIGEKVRPGYLAEIRASDPIRTKEGIWICPVADLCV